MSTDPVSEFVSLFAASLQDRDEQACAALWGRGSMVLADAFEAVADAPEELEPFLAGAWPIYEYLDLTRIEYRILESVRLTDSLTRVLVRYSFFDGTGAFLVDGDFEYVLRREDDRLRCHMGVNISAEPNLAGLARSRGYATGVGGSGRAGVDQDAGAVAGVDQGIGAGDR